MQRKTLLVAREYEKRTKTSASIRECESQYWQKRQYGKLSYDSEFKPTFV
jgi:hypothetical protein